jgi:hypothetical protein
MRSAISDFESSGFVRVPGAFSAAVAAGICERIWQELARRHGIRREGRESWTVDQPRHLQALRRSGAFDALASPILIDVVDRLLGAGSWQRPRHWGDPLISLPRAGSEWTVPYLQWHIDWPARCPAHPLFALKVLAFAGPVAAGGGGTLILAGSHLLVERLVEQLPADDRGHSSRVRGLLARAHPWLRSLVENQPCGDRIQRFMHDGAVLDGVVLRVVELTGGPGDAVVLHPWLFHAPASNCSGEPRFMIGQNLNTARGLALYATHLH